MIQAGGSLVPASGRCGPGRRPGFIADADHGGFDYLFKWYGAGDVEVPTGNPDMTLKVSAASAEHQRPDDRPTDDENFVFVTTGIEDAVAKATEIADDKDVGVNGGEIARQCFDAGPLDEVHVDLVPVFLGSGIALLGMIKHAPVELDGPISVTEGKGVTHLGYRVVRN